MHIHFIRLPNQKRKTTCLTQRPRRNCRGWQEACMSRTARADVVITYNWYSQPRWIREKRPAHDETVPIYLAIASLWNPTDQVQTCNQTIPGTCYNEVSYNEYTIIISGSWYVPSHTLIYKYPLSTVAVLLFSAWSNFQNKVYRVDRKLIISRAIPTSVRSLTAARENLRVQMSCLCISRSAALFVPVWCNCHPLP